MVYTCVLVFVGGEGVGVDILRVLDWWSWWALMKKLTTWIKQPGTFCVVIDYTFAPFPLVSIPHCVRIFTMDSVGGERKFLQNSAN